jgi:hypothetical protein
VQPAAVALLVLVLAAPGLGLVRALAPPDVWPWQARLGLVLPFGYAAIATASLLLAIAGLHRPIWAVAAWIVVTGLAWALAARRPRRRSTAISAVDPVLVVAAVAFVGFLLVRMTYTPEANLAQTPLRYWADGLEIADAHGIPDATLQWGEPLRPATSKAVLNAFHASASVLLGRGPLEPMGALGAVASIGLVLVWFAIARELGLRRTAPLVPVLLFANRAIGNDDLTVDLTTNLAENWGRLVAFAGVLVALHALRRAYRLEGAAAGDGGGTAVDRDGRRAASARRDAVVAGLLFGVGAGTHLVPVTVGLAIVGCYAAALSLGRRPRFRPAIGEIMPLGVAAVAVGALLLSVPGGDLGFEGAVDEAAYDGIRAELGLPASFDPTEYLAWGYRDRDGAPSVWGFAAPPGREAAQFLGAATGVARTPEGVRLVIGPGIAALLAAAAFVWGSRDERRTAVAALLLAAVLFATTMAFLFRYDVFVLAHFGRRRLFSYLGVPGVLLAAAAFEASLARLVRWRAARCSSGRGGVGTAVAATAAVGLAALLVLPSAVAPDGLLERRGREVEVLGWVGRHVPCDGRILADRRTLATFETMTGHVGVIEGMGPHVRPAVLEVALRELLEATAFFEAPERGEVYLREHGVAAVVVTRGEHELGGWHKLRPDLDGIDPRAPDADPFAGVPFLEVGTVTEAATVYRVAGSGSGSGGC